MHGYPSLSIPLVASVVYLSCDPNRSYEVSLVDGGRRLCSSEV